MTTAAFAWLDTETTGLVPSVHDILEVGITITDADFNLIESRAVIVGHREGMLSFQSDKGVNVQQMHESSGLLEMVYRSQVTYGDAESWMIGFMREHFPDGHPPMAGSSLRHDRNFLDRLMPLLHECFHYRSIDVSTVKELARYCAPGVLEEWESERERLFGSKRHRTLADLEESIAELKFYESAMRHGLWMNP